MASKYLTASAFIVYDGDVALAADLNSVTSAVEAGFDTVLQDFASIATEINNAVSYSTEWANAAEDVLVSAAAGGDLIDDYSALHHAAKAAAAAIATAADLVETAADVVITNADAATTTQDAIDTAADAAATAADVLVTNADALATAADAATTTQDAIDTAADAAATALDKIATNADVVLTAADAAATALDKIATNADVVLTAADAAATALDKIATNADVVLTAADAAATALDVIDASNSADAAEAAYDSFDDRYLGPKASNPTLDNDGAALISGALYWNTTTNEMRVYDGAAWNALGAGGAVGGGSDAVIYENDTNVTADYTITTGKNAMSAGPITVDTGATVTIPTGSVWTVV